MEEKDNIDKLIEATSDMKVPELRSKEEAWKLFEQKIESRKQEKKTIKLYPYLPIGIAATLALFIVAYFFLLNGKTISTQRGEHLSLTLPDASTIVCNAESEVRYNPRSWDKNRTVEMKGEVFFEVNPGSSFIVETETGQVHVVGTRFNVKQREGSFEVSCFSGSVNVSDKQGNTVTLKAGEFTKLVNNTLLAASVVDDKKASWRTGDFHFENAQLNSVVEELELQYNVEIEMKSSSERRYTGYFTNKNLKEALQLVFVPMGLTYKIEDKKILVQ